MQAGPYAAAAQPAPPTSDTPVRPSAWWFGLAALVGIGGIVAAIVIGVSAASAFTDRIEGFQRVDVPGSGPVTFDEPGGYTVYEEDGATRFSSLVRDLDLTDPDGDPVPLRAYTSTVTYGWDGRDGVAVYSFQIDQPGDYELSADGAGGTLAVGRGLGRGIVTGVVGVLVAGFGGILAGAIIAIVVGVRRGRDRRRRQVWGPQPAWSGAASPGPGPQGSGGRPPAGWVPPPSGWSQQPGTTQPGLPPSGTPPVAPTPPIHWAPPTAPSSPPPRDAASPDEPPSPPFG